MKRQMTMQDIAQQALFAQDACNLSGLVYALGNMMDAICAEDREHNHGTEWKNTHPVMVLMLNKMAGLARADDNFSRAYDAVKQMASGEKLVVENKGG